MARVLTAWPASDEITRPWLGYITRPMRVVRIENFSLDEMLSAADFRANVSSNYEVALIFSTKYEPGTCAVGSLAYLDGIEVAVLSAFIAICRPPPRRRFSAATLCFQNGARDNGSP